MCIKCQLTSREAVAIAVAVHEAKKHKIPSWKNIVFFGKHTLWHYHEKSDDRLCPECRFYATKPAYFGDAIRAFFPYLMIMDENTIRVNVHPNCRCILKRFED